MTAFLRKFLILQLDRLGAGSLIAAHRMIHVEEAAITRVAIGDQGRLDALGDLAHAAHHVGIGGKAGIRIAEMRRHDPEAGHVERIETGPVRELRRDEVVDAGGDNEAWPVEAGREGVRHGRIPVTLSRPRSRPGQALQFTVRDR